MLKTADVWLVFLITSHNLAIGPSDKLISNLWWQIIIDAAGIFGITQLVSCIDGPLLASSI